MEFGELFHSYWWIIFPLFGMGMGVLGMLDSSRRTKQMMDLMRTYAEQGKDPPPELLRVLQNQMDYNNDAGQYGAGGKWWVVLIFTAIATGFGTAYWFVRAEDYAFAFMMVAIITGVIALGALAIALFVKPKA